MSNVHFQKNHIVDDGPSMIEEPLCTISKATNIRVIKNKSIIHFQRDLYIFRKIAENYNKFINHASDFEALLLC